MSKRRKKNTHNYNFAVNHKPSDIVKKHKEVFDRAIANYNQKIKLMNENKMLNNSKTEALYITENRKAYYERMILKEKQLKNFLNTINSLTFESTKKSKKNNRITKFEEQLIKKNKYWVEKFSKKYDIDTIDKIKTKDQKTLNTYLTKNAYEIYTRLLGARYNIESDDTIFRQNYEKALARIFNEQEKESKADGKKTIAQMLKQISDNRLRWLLENYTVFSIEEVYEDSIDTKKRYELIYENFEAELKTQKENRERYRKQKEKEENEAKTQLRRLKKKTSKENIKIMKKVLKQYRKKHKALFMNEEE